MSDNSQGLVDSGQVLPTTNGISLNGRRRIKTFNMDDKVVLNIGGTRFTTFYSTLVKIPNSRLALLTKNDSAYDVQEGEFFFDKNPKLFEYVLDCYREGELHFPHCMCGPSVRRELDYWNIKESRIAACCWKSYKEYEEEEKTMEILESTFCSQRERLLGSLSDSKTVIRHGWTKWRRDILLFLEDPTSSAAAKMWTYFFIVMLLVSIGVVCAETHPWMRVNLEGAPPINLTNHTNPKLIMYLTTQPRLFLRIAEYICTFIFFIELITKFLVWPRKWTFFMSFFNVIDILSVVPMVLNACVRIFSPFLFVRKGDVFTAYCVVALASVFRAIRVLKLVKHNRGLQVMYLAVRSSAQQIMLLLLIMFIGTLVFSTMIYFAEFNEEQNFMNIPIGFWWSVITMTTVGYGDEHPTSPLGYLIGSLCAIAGMLATAMPIPVIANSFHLYYTYSKIKTKLDEKRRECQENEHYGDVSRGGSSGDGVRREERRSLLKKSNCFINTTVT